MEKLRIRKWFKRFDQFGEKFSFKYNNYDKYSTAVGGLFSIIFWMASLAIFIINSLPFFQKKNISLQFYSINIDSEELNLYKNFAFGIDCDGKNNTEEAKEYFNLNLTHINKEKINDNETNKDTAPIEPQECNKDYFEDELNNIIGNITIHDLHINDFKCLPEKNESQYIKGIYTDQIFAYYQITISSKKGKKISDINNFLLNKDCKLQFYYTDYTIDIENDTKYFKPLLNSLFLQK